MIQNNFSNYNLCKFSGNIILLEKNIAFESENIFDTESKISNNMSLNFPNKNHPKK